MNERDLIRRFFLKQPVTRDDVRLGIGDDAALVAVPPGQELAITTDTLVAGVDFLADADPSTVGHKALAVNLSDLAAMGAAPAWFTLTLSLPSADAQWLAAFARGLFALAQRHGIVLIGGDLSRGPLAVDISAYGHVPVGQALQRRGAAVGDAIFVTGTIGDAALALSHLLDGRPLVAEDAAAVGERLHRPIPRVAEGLRLRGVASAAIDLSDGLLSDLGRIAEASRVGARIHLNQLPLSDAYRRYLAQVGYDPAIATGDDYELCFTVPPGRVAALEKAGAFESGITRIGEIVAGTAVRVVDAQGADYVPSRRGYDHFEQQRLK